MICVSLSGVDRETVRLTLEKEELVELRLDGLPIAAELPELIRNAKAQVLVAYRPKPDESESERAVRRDLLISTIEAGAAYVDVEFDADSQYRGKLLRAARAAGIKIIFSYHNFEKTPSQAELLKITQQSFEAGADIVKIATLVKRKDDNLKLLSLLADHRPVVVVGMGTLGTVTRVVAPLLGSPFTFASLDEHHKTALGQLTVSQMREIFATLWRFGLK